MYQNIYYDSSKRKVHIWDDKNGHVMVPFKKYAYVKDSYGTHVSLYGDRLKKIFGGIKMLKDYLKVILILRQEPLSICIPIVMNLQQVIR